MVNSNIPGAPSLGTRGKGKFGSQVKVKIKDDPSTHHSPESKKSKLKIWINLKLGAFLILILWFWEKTKILNFFSHSVADSSSARQLFLLSEEYKKIIHVTNINEEIMINHVSPTYPSPSPESFENKTSHSHRDLNEKNHPIWKGLWVFSQKGFENSVASYLSILHPRVSHRKRTDPRLTCRK